MDDLSGWDKYYRMAVFVRQPTPLREGGLRGEFFNTEEKQRTTESTESL